MTGVFAMIPFAAKLIFGDCALALIAEGRMATGSSLFVFGVVVILPIAACITRKKNMQAQLPFDKLGMKTYRPKPLKIK